MHEHPDLAFVAREELPQVGSNVTVSLVDCANGWRLVHRQLENSLDYNYLSHVGLRTLRVEHSDQPSISILCMLPPTVGADKDPAQRNGHVGVRRDREPGDVAEGASACRRRPPFVTGRGENRSRTQVGVCHIV